MEFRTKNHGWAQDEVNWEALARDSWDVTNWEEDDDDEEEAEDES
jgi:hypothetical protein